MKLATYIPFWKTVPIFAIQESTFAKVFEVSLNILVSLSITRLGKPKC